MITDSSIIEPQTLKLFKTLQSDEALQSFFLVGGTSLALQIGHRLSVDLDLFSLDEFDTQNLQNHLTAQYGFFTDFIAKNTLKGFISGVKVDFITHSYPLVNPLLKEGNLRLASTLDIAAMKLNAIGHNGNRQKDFYDMYYLLETHSLNDMLEAYSQKYINSNPVIPLKGITYFEDIDFKIEHPILKRPIIFQDVKNRLIEATLKPDKKFGSL